MKNRHFPVIVEQDEDGVYIVSCPQLKGCRSYGSTIDEAVQNITEAIELCLEDHSVVEALDTFVGFREIEVQLAETASS